MSSAISIHANSDFQITLSPEHLSQLSITLPSSLPQHYHQIISRPQDNLKIIPASCYPYSPTLPLTRSSPLLPHPHLLSVSVKYLLAPLLPIHLLHLPHHLFTLALVIFTYRHPTPSTPTFIHFLLYTSSKNCGSRYNQ